MVARPNPPGDDPRRPDRVRVLDLGYASERPHDLPLSPPDVKADTIQAIQDMESRRKAAALGLENPSHPTRRPDLDHDVTQGILSRALDRTIGR